MKEEKKYSTNNFDIRNILQATSTSERIWEQTEGINTEVEEYNKGDEEGVGRIVPTNQSFEDYLE